MGNLWKHGIIIFWYRSIYLQSWELIKLSYVLDKYKNAGSLNTWILLKRWINRSSAPILREASITLAFIRTISIVFKISATAISFNNRY